MRNDIYFRVHYPYGIVLDVENGTFALFNRYYKRLKKKQDEDIKSMPISKLLDFIPCKTVNEELKQQLQVMVDRNNSCMDCEIAEDRFFRVWLYNDCTNPYAYAKRNTYRYKSYMEKVNDISELMGVNLMDYVIQF